MIINLNKNKYNILRVSIIMLMILTLTLLSTNKKDGAITTNSQELSNKKIGWGIKREDNHEQPDVGSTNKALLEKYGGIALGDKQEKFIYLTFDEGYEAGYTSKILDTLKENNITATFFITAHYLNTQPDLVKRMIDEGHIVGNHTPKSLMSLNYKIIKC